MEPARSTQCDQIKGKMDDSPQFFVKYPRAKLCHIVIQIKQEQFSEFHFRLYCSFVLSIC